MTSLLPLEDFRRIIGLAPFHFYGLLSTQYNPVTSACNDIVKKYGWQASDQLGRADIEEAIESAERKLRDYLGHNIAPAYSSITVPWPTYYDRTRSRYATFDADGRFIGIRLPYGNGYIQAAGVESRTLIGAASLANGKLVVTDTDADNLIDTFTITIATTETDATKIAVYFGSADRLDGEAVSEAWRIRPVKVTISGGNAIIKGRYWLLVKPIKYEGVSPQPLDPATAGNFADSLDVYVRTTDPDGDMVDDSQAVLIWETRPCSGWWCCCSDCSALDYTPADSSLDPAAQGMAIARAGIRDSKMGEVTIGGAVLNATTGIWSAAGRGTGFEPDRALVRIYAGYPLESGQVAEKWQKITAHLAAAEMTRNVCACDVANRTIHHWSFDLARTGGNNDERFAISAEDLNGPFGTRRGQVEAWKAVRALRLTPGMVDH